MLNDKSSDLPAGMAALATEDRPPRPRPRGLEPALRWTGGWGGWPDFVRILLWATRNNRTSAGPPGARRPNGPASRLVIATAVAAAVAAAVTAWLVASFWQ